MFPTANAYSSFATNDVAASKRFYGETLGLDVGELYDGTLLELRLADDKRVLVYDKPDFVPATYTVLNFPVPDVDAAVEELTTVGRGDGPLRRLRPGRQGHRPRRRADHRLVPRSDRQHPGRPRRVAAARLTVTPGWCRMG